MRAQRTGSSRAASTLCPRRRSRFTATSENRMPLWFCQGQLSWHAEERQSAVRCGGTGESVHGAAPSVATSAGKVRLMNGEWAGMTGEMTLTRVIPGQFEYSQQNVLASFPFVVTYSDLP